METYNLAVATKKLYESGLKLFTARNLKELLEVNKRDTAFSVIRRFIKNGLLVRIERDKYSFTGVRVHDFLLANFLYPPSYISLETALNFHGILSQFPYEIISISSRKTAKKTIEGKSYVYIHLQKSLFWGYEKRGDYLVASPEKAILDQLYFIAKGLRSANLDEWDFSSVNKKRLKEYAENFPKTGQLRRMKSLIGPYISI